MAQRDGVSPELKQTYKEETQYTYICLAMTPNTLLDPLKSIQFWNISIKSRRKSSMDA